MKLIDQTPPVFTSCPANVTHTAKLKLSGKVLGVTIAVLPNRRITKPEQFSTWNLLQRVTYIQQQMIWNVAST